MNFLNFENDDQHFMRLAIRQAISAMDAGDVPVGAVITRNGRVIAQAHNQVELLKDPTAHAEMIAITQAASAVGDWRLTDTVLYVTKEPCRMCSGAISLARIPKIVFGALDPENAGPMTAQEIIKGVLEEDCKNMLQEFFRNIRANPEKKLRVVYENGDENG